MDRPVVSFCIATFQRYEIVKELIEEILSVKSDKLEVVVCDNKSSDDSVEKLKKIDDRRLKIFVNEKNVGSSLNVHESLDKGNGKYLFYVNDRDNVDAFKIEKLIVILEELEKEGVAFAKCCVAGGCAEKYYIFNKGREALLWGACKIDHPTGYIFKRDIWKKIKNKRILFENEKYGDYPITQVCAIIAKKYKGAMISGDICDVKRRRIDFMKEKSGFYTNRRDKRLWYTPEVIFREVQIGQKFLKRIGVEADIREQILINRYAEYFPWCVTDYKNRILDPIYTVHYNFYPYQDFFHVFFASIWNGLKLWGSISLLCTVESRKVYSQIHKISRQEYKKYFKSVLSELFLKGKREKDYKKNENEILKREKVLQTYERWVNEFIDKRTVTDFLLTKGYTHIAIYGMGRIGKHLLRECRKSDIRVDYVIDQKISEEKQYYEDKPCYNINPDLPYTDIIIVTISDAMENIIAELKKNVNWKIKSINDILFVLD